MNNWVNIVIKIITKLEKTEEKSKDFYQRKSKWKKKDHHNRNKKLLLTRNRWKGNSPWELENERQKYAL